jgi:hypothetical protein
MLTLISCSDRSGVPTSDVLQERKPGRDGGQQDNHQRWLHGQRTHPSARPLCRHRRGVDSQTGFKTCYLTLSIRAIRDELRYFNKQTGACN